MFFSQVGDLNTITTDAYNQALEKTKQANGSIQVDVAR